MNRPRYHDRRINAAWPKSTPEQIRRANEITAQVTREFAERYPGGINAENVDEVIAWQQKRIRELQGY